MSTSEMKPSIESGEPPLLVFISSIQSVDFKQARATATTAIRSFGEKSMIAWAFEYTPATPDPPRETYLRGVRNCELFIWLFDDVTTQAVRDEVSLAISLEKPKIVLRFPKKQPLDESTRELITEISESVKYCHTSLEHLENDLIVAVIDLLLRSFRIAYDSKKPYPIDKASKESGIQPIGDEDNVCVEGIITDEHRYYLEVTNCGAKPANNVYWEWVNEGLANSNMMPAVRENPFPFQVLECTASVRLEYFPVSETKHHLEVKVTWSSPNDIWHSKRWPVFWEE